MTLRPRTKRSEIRRSRDKKYSGHTIDRLLLYYSSGNVTEVSRSGSSSSVDIKFNLRVYVQDVSCQMQSIRNGSEDHLERKLPGNFKLSTSLTLVPFPDSPQQVPGSWSSALNVTRWQNNQKDSCVYAVFLRQHPDSSFWNDSRHWTGRCVSC